jgi:hypothetical protein
MKLSPTFIYVPFVLIALVGAARAQIAIYGFGPTGTPTLAATSSASNVTTSSFASFTGSGTTGTSSPGSSTAGGGGGAYFTSANWRSSDGNYVYFTITPADGYQVSLTSFSYYYASTSTGPNSLSLFSSSDSYTSSLSGTQSLTKQAGGDLLSTDWHQNSGSISLTFTSPTTFRLTGTGASISTGSLRLDAVTLNGSVSAIPEPSTYGAIVGGLALIGALWHRRRQRR